MPSVSANQDSVIVPVCDNNTEALIFKMAVARFLDVSEEETNTMKENAFCLIINTRKRV